MILKQFRYEPLGQASYLVGCIRAREAVVVDPISNLGADFYVLEAADLGLTITSVIETHIHADFISCGRGLAEITGADYRIHESAPVTFEFGPIRDGEIIELGKVRLEAIHTPGHTPDHMCFLVSDRARSEEPWFILSGDSLFVGDVGRPDLLLGDSLSDGSGEWDRAALQFRSIRDRLLTLPGHVEVYPNHYGGSSCGGVNMSGKASSTIHFERLHNLAMLQPDEAAFAAFVAETAKPFPDDYRRIKAINLGLVEPAAVGLR